MTAGDVADSGDSGEGPGSVLARHQEARARALAMGGEERLARRRAGGLLNARERIAVLLDPDSFQELGLHAGAGRPGGAAAPADGKVAGFGRIDGRPVMAVANDFTVRGASSTPVNGRKIAHVKALATKGGLPIVWLGESSGARIPDAMGADGMGQSGQDPTQYTRFRETPWASAVLGPCFGSSTWYACLSDFVVMRKGAVLAVAGPRVTGRAVAQKVDPEALGGWRLHAERTGMADQVAETDEEAIAAVRRFLSYLPGHNRQAPPLGAADAEAGAPAETLLDIVPADRAKVYDMARVVAAVVDAGSLFPIKPSYGRAAITGLARIGGRPLGIVASNPMVKGGALDPEACAKVTGFLVLCDSFNLPLVFLVDTPGFLVGAEGEGRLAPGWIMNHMQALQMCTVPKVVLILRKLYGQAYLNFGGGRNSDIIGAWPGADIGFMDPGIGVEVVHGAGLAETDPERFAALRAEMMADSSAYALANIYAAHDVVDPRDSRAWLAAMLGYLTAGGRSVVSEHLLAGWPSTLLVGRGIERQGAK